MWDWDKTKYSGGVLSNGGRNTSLGIVHQLDSIILAVRKNFHIFPNDVKGMISTNTFRCPWPPDHLPHWREGRCVVSGQCVMLSIFVNFVALILPPLRSNALSAVHHTTLKAETWIFSVNSTHRQWVLLHFPVNIQLQNTLHFNCLLPLFSTEHCCPRSRCGGAHLWTLESRATSDWPSPPWKLSNCPLPWTPAQHWPSCAPYLPLASPCTTAPPNTRLIYIYIYTIITPF